MFNKISSAQVNYGSYNNKVIDKISWICIKDRALLCARTIGRDLFYIPGGKREPGESDQDTLIREIKEEIGVNINPQSINYANNFTGLADGKSNINVKLTCYFAEYNSGTISPNSEIEEIKWINYKDCDKCSLACRLVLEWLKLENIID